MTVTETAIPDSGLRITTEVKAQSAADREVREPDIVIKDCNLSYGDNHVLHDITMDMEDRRVTALIGPSGCGKSTLLRCLNRMNDLIDNVKVTGSIKVKGLDINAASDRRDRGAAPGGHGLPEVEPLPEVDLRERGLRPAHRRDQRQGHPRRGLRAARSRGRPSGTR